MNKEDIKSIINMILIAYENGYHVSQQDYNNFHDAIDTLIRIKTKIGVKK